MEYCFWKWVVTIWGAIMCVKVITEKPIKEWGLLKIIMILLIFIYGIAIMIGVFTRKFPEKIAFLIAAPTPIYFLSMISVLWAYDLISISGIIILDLFILYWIILSIELLIRKYFGKNSSNKNSSGYNF